jgi:hypothetical protein
VKEFVSIKVSSFDHAALATSLTTKAAEGWAVVSVLAVGNDIVAYLSRETITSATSPASGSSVAAAATTGASEPSGWGAANTSDAASAPTQAMTATTNTGAVSTETSSAATPSTTTTTPSVPADWYKDPSGRYEYRYWDGQKWTEHVSRAGTVYKDPPTP